MLHTDATFDVFVATLNRDGVLLDELASLELPKIEEFKLTSFYNVNFVKQVRRCAAYMRENKIDVVHTHDFYTNVFGMAAATLAGVKFRIASKRETGGMRSSAQEFVEKLAFGRADAIVVNAASVRDHLIERSVPKEKIRIIYNGVDLSRFSNSAPDKAVVLEKYELPADEDAKFVTLVANLRHRVKNVPMLLRSVRAVVVAIPNANFVIAGEGELETAFVELAAELGVGGNVNFIGRCTDIPELLSVSDVCVLTSTAEGFSNSILEYMAAGKPVVATNVGGAAEAVIDGGTGYLVPSDDDSTLAARVMELLADNEKSSRFGSKGRQIVTEKFSQYAQLKATLDLYADVED